MTDKKDGKVYTAVAKLLREAGLQNLQGLEIATLGRGTDHIIVLDGETIGEYNHTSRRLFLYDNDI